MISKRTRYSLAQYLELHEISFVTVMLNKNGIRASIGYGHQLADVLDCLRSATDEEILLVVDEIARTSGDLRSRISLKYRHDERISDLSRFLNLDGYIVDGKKVIPVDPLICDSPPLEDDLLEALRQSGLSESEIISSKINDSTEAFRASPPKYNACLNDVRVSLESLARSITRAFESEDSPTYDPAKWGSILNFLTQVVNCREKRNSEGMKLSE